MTVQKPPEGLSKQARDLWRGVLGQFRLDDHEISLLAQACECLSHIEELEKQVRAEGRIISDARGTRAHPALTEARQQRIVYTRIIATLGFGDDGRKANRHKARGLYSVPGGA